VRKNTKKIIAFATPVAIGLDMVKPSPAHRLVHGKLQLLNAKTQTAPTINRKGQQKIVDSVSFACTDKNDSKKTISYKNNMSRNDGGYIIPLGRQCIKP
jgi:hypothetical protein